MDKRNSKRVAADEAVGASCGSFDMELFVVDLSETGCKVEVSGTSLRPGYAIALFFAPGVVTTGTVVWRNGFHAGIEFQRKLKASLLDEFAHAPVLVEVERGGPLAA
jgi:hypothetical protein